MKPTSSPKSARCPLCHTDLSEATDYVVLLVHKETAPRTGGVHVLGAKELQRYCLNCSPWKRIPSA